jgi:glycosyltransferase involved in cell wall biosynthesis
MLAVTVILPTFRRPDVLGDTIARLAGQTVGSGNIELIVIDDANDAGVREETGKRAGRFGSFVYIGQNGEGQSRARNRAAAQAKADLLFFMGDDILLAPDVLQKHVEFHSRQPQRNVAVMGKIDIDPRQKNDLFVKWLYDSGTQFSFWRISGEGYIHPDQAETAHLSIPREHAVKFPFDERLRYFENYVWAHELFQTGFLFYYLPGARSHHYHPVNLKKYGERMFAIGRTIALLEREGHPYFTEMGQGMRRVNRFTLLRYKTAGLLLGSRRYLYKYWKSRLNDIRYHGYVSYGKGKG